MAPSQTCGTLASGVQSLAAAVGDGIWDCIPSVTDCQPCTAARGATQAVWVGLWPGPGLSPAWAGSHSHSPPPATSPRHSFVQLCGCVPVLLFSGGAAEPIDHASTKVPGGPRPSSPFRRSSTRFYLSSSSRILFEESHTRREVIMPNFDAN
ncbi:hypothetical protein U9M48_010827 [Paspalum notatum var. saurae]|uniref:Uncharacterized protein n=1 Tax=Paspalum notatum var. saurae TaxID=547442 RepID=A0AAQ3SU15_PASNO